MLRTFFRDGRLTEIPAEGIEATDILERIATEFDPGDRYDGARGERDRRAPSTTTPRSVDTSSTKGSSIETPAVLGAGGRIDV
ncbi:MAG: hypothetical protein M3138_02760 [Actinomycetota bacterium]|nr:hypothetical protein [Actinomycetota bacterium]